ncbi:DUF887-domain-containing protein [Chiua virens]|nr:DUF887-domain-containing protein [Chiua virens]
MIPELRQHIRDAARPLADKYGLSTLPEFADVVVIAWLFFTVLQFSLSPAISRAVFPVSYTKADKRTRRNWDVHVVSLVHALVATLLASRCLHVKSLDEDRAFGTYPDASFLFAIALGYFMWDAFESIFHFSDIGFVIHGVACLAIFVLGSRPFVHYYAVRFLLWEVSTIFLNINWFLDKLGKTGSKLQLANGVALLSSFFCVRLVWGGKMSYDFFVTLNGIYTEIPLLYIMLYGTSNLMLQGLNWFWFTKMISALRKRFAGKSAKGKSNGHGLLNVNGNGKIDGHLE